MNVPPEITEIERRAGAADIPLTRVLRRANVAQTTWWRWTQGHVGPRLSTLSQVRAALDAEIEASGKAAA